MAILHVLKAAVGAAIVALAIGSSAASGQAQGTVFTDLWWNPAESGWGVTVNHQREVMFLTFFVYRPDGSPYWVVGTLTYFEMGAPNNVFKGDLYEVRGPWFGGPFDSSAVSERIVGKATFAASERNAATLAYDIEGVSVIKSVQRQTLRYLDFTGGYLATVTYSNTGGLAIVVHAFAPLEVKQDGAAIQMSWGTIGWPEPKYDCIFSGNYSQTGLLGRADGSVACTQTSSGQGKMTFTDIQWTTTGLSATASAVGMCGGVGSYVPCTLEYVMAATRVSGYAKPRTNAAE
jgi:hypothetical protein